MWNMKTVWRYICSADHSIFKRCFPLSTYTQIYMYARMRVCSTSHIDCWWRSERMGRWHLFYIFRVHKLLWLVWCALCVVCTHSQGKLYIVLVGAAAVWCRLYMHSERKCTFGLCIARWLFGRCRTVHREQHHIVKRTQSMVWGTGLQWAVRRIECTALHSI